MPDGLLPGQRATWRDQDAFLKTFAKVGTRSTACRAIGISTSQPSFWEQTDSLGFKARLALAEQAWGDHLEQVAFERIASPDKNRGSDLLLITLLNAYKPLRYKPAIVLSDNTLSETLEALRTIKRKLRDHETKANQAQGLLDAPDAIEEAEQLLASRLPPVKGQDEG